MRPYLWALASICFELAAALGDPAAPVAAEACGGPPPSRALELELELARGADVYLKVDAGCRELTVVAGGVELASMPIAGVEFLAYRPASGAGARPALELPAVLTVAEDVSAGSRRVVAPPVLRPYSQRDDPAPPAPAAVDEPTAPPSSYRVRLEDGKVLELGPRPAARGIASRIAQALRDGWRILFHERPERPDRVVLVIDPEDARRLRHLFRGGTRILVLVGSPG